MFQLQSWYHKVTTPKGWHLYVLVFVATSFSQILIWKKHCGHRLFTSFTMKMGDLIFKNPWHSARVNGVMFNLEHGFAGFRRTLWTPKVLPLQGNNLAIFNIWTWWSFSAACIHELFWLNFKIFQWFANMYGTKKTRHLAVIEARAIVPTTELQSISSAKIQIDIYRCQWLKSNVLHSWLALAVG